jgi:hypothetical protein
MYEVAYMLLDADRRVRQPPMFFAGAWNVHRPIAAWTSCPTEASNRGPSRDATTPVHC